MSSICFALGSAAPSRDQRVPFWIAYGVESEVYVELRPVEVARMRPLDVKHCGDTSVAKPGELVECQVELLVVR
jgi:hypothetical protein